MPVLDKELRQELVRMLSQFLEMEKETAEQSEIAWKPWKTDNIYEFIYGHWVGYFTGLFEGVIQGRYNRDISFEERNEILELVEEYAPRIRDHLSNLK